MFASDKLRKKKHVFCIVIAVNNDMHMFIKGLCFQTFSLHVSFTQDASLPKYNAVLDKCIMIR